MLCLSSLRRLSTASRTRPSSPASRGGYQLEEGVQPPCPVVVVCMHNDKATLLRGGSKSFVFGNEGRGGADVGEAEEQGGSGGRRGGGRYLTVNVAPSTARRGPPETVTLMVCLPGRRLGRIARIRSVEAE